MINHRKVQKGLNLIIAVSHHLSYCLTGNFNMWNCFVKFAQLEPLIVCFISFCTFFFWSFCCLSFNLRILIIPIGNSTLNEKNNIINSILTSLHTRIAFTFTDNSYFSFSSESLIRQSTSHFYSFKTKQFGCCTTFTTRLEHWVEKMEYTIWCLLFIFTRQWYNGYYTKFGIKK